ncbi:MULTISPECIES: DUF1972 domain-containing protein [Pseudoxanthomonas]|uniref:Glycosyltransferase involved in cell wall biosynthesis n=1 Tax=Pseudoxanthomonas winnipegensis TaxID=2480810 RepID=A0AAW8GEK9_9GAMM|nr:MULTISPECIES: DUF1972 domain-containing protein [Pseudoxanthomonas]MDQ1120247.1 glycosyltransferase involved in cell wall biosynthesis [Pseudoxanthomonas winnipegensis]MDQ1133459.1 glycosyltransferase involved in cell wall biosynthesis [Pseudoxanthomonas winnipegensis]MDR6140296.1 glycosyltransferase involved in cell wall biosynthesis [Pseudoxanthomonas sp. SORGH_AS_0997]
MTSSAKIPVARERHAAREPTRRHLREKKALRCPGQVIAAQGVFSTAWHWASGTAIGAGQDARTLHRPAHGRADMLEGWRCRFRTFPGQAPPSRTRGLTEMAPNSAESASRALRMMNAVAAMCLQKEQAMPHRQISILGTRGIPAMHGGFETFAERLALHLVQRGWRVTVYCQAGPEQEQPVIEDQWQGVHRVTIGVKASGARGTMAFDWRSIRHAARTRAPLVLTLGYNTALFSTWLRLCGVTNVINMDGLEWKRRKWRTHERLWLWANERIGCWAGHHLIADHPEIAQHLATRVRTDKIAMIPYGADLIEDIGDEALEPLGLKGARYGVVIARPEPENSLLEIVTAFSRRRRDARLVVLGRYEPQGNAYHRQVLDAASPEVDFPGAIYDPATLRALRRHALFYVHGHTVGGTNPSLVEALGAGNAVIAHDNPFNRWVAQDGARYFHSVIDCDMHLSALLEDPEAVAAMRRASRQRFDREFRWSFVLAQYQALLEGMLPRASTWPAALPTPTAADIGPGRGPAR